MSRARAVMLGGLTVALAMILTTIPAPTAAQDQAAVTEAVANLRWRHIGPVNMGGRVSAIVGMPANPKTFWVGGADGGVWKTTNGGITFEGQWQDAGTYSVGALALAPSDFNVLWLGAGEGDPRNSVSYGDGVYRSTDGGQSWTHLGLDDTERIKRIVVDPRNADVALVCAMGHEWGPNEERGVFKTTDGGQTWTKVLYIDQDTGCSDLDIDLTNPRNVYAGMWTFRRRPWRFDDGGRETALYVSRDAGDTWKKITTTPDEPMARIGISVAQSRPNIVYLITEYPTAGTLFRSEDYGETWEMINDDRNALNFRPFYYSDVFVDPSDHETMFTLSGGLSKSTDGGRTFQRIGRGVHGDHQAFWIDPADGEHVLSGSDGGMQVSYDGGANFHIFRNVSLAQYYHVFVDDRDPYWVCGGLQDNGNWCGPSRTNGGGIPAGDWYTVSGGDGFYTVPVPGQPNLVYSNAQGGYFRITDTKSGQTRSIEPWPWMIGSQGQSMAQARYRFNWDAPIYISPHDPQTVYWGGNVLFRSRDYGFSWDVISPDLTTNDPAKQADSGGEIYNDNTAAEFHTTILTVAESPVERGVLWVGTDDGNVQISRDDGATWTNVRDRVPGLPAETWIGNIEASPMERGVAFMAVDNHRLDDFTPHVYETRDYGRSWRDISAGLPADDYVKVIRQHPANPNLLFVGMDLGIFASFDRGDSWVSIRGGNLPPVSVRGIRVQEQYNDLVIGTHGRGAWILDDIQPLVELADAVNEDLHVFTARTATEWESWNRGSNIGQSVFEGENPPDGAYINFYLSATAASQLERPRGGRGGGQEGGGLAAFFGGGSSGPAFAPTEGVGNITIRITNDRGDTVKELQHRNAGPGINRAVWDLTWDGAEPIPGQQGGGGGFFRFFGGGGPPAVPGTYTATVIAGNHEGSTTFQLRGDPNVAASQADYEARFMTAMRARDLQTELNRMAGTIGDLNGQINGLLESIRGKDLTNAGEIRETAGEASDKLTALDAEIRRPPGSMNYRDWPRLIEQLRNVVRGMQGPQARPTEGQIEVLTQVEADAARRAGELTAIVDGVIADLNRLLRDAPKIITDWRRISE